MEILIKLYKLCFIFCAVFLIACAPIGDNQGFSLNEKRLIRDFYHIEDPLNEYYLDPNLPPWILYYGQEKTEEAVTTDFHVKCSINNIDPADIETCNKYKNYQKALKLYHKKKSKREHRISERIFGLVPNKVSEKPYALSDPYDIRLRKPIRSGSPLSIIINRVHLASNRETLLFELDYAEVAVVISVHDGTSKKSKDTLVAFNTLVNDNVNLPISNLLAYYTESYNNSPIRVTVSVLEFDQQENETLTNILSLAASTISAQNPSLATPNTIAGDIGSLLLSKNKDDIITEFTFQVYPWKDGTITNKGDTFGVPVVTYGQTIIINSNQAKYYDRNKYHVDYGLNIWEYDVSDEQIHGLQDKLSANTACTCSQGATETGFATEEFPAILDPTVRNITPTRLEQTYLALTIDSLHMSGAQEIIKASHKLATDLAGLDPNDFSASSVHNIQSSANELGKIQQLTSWYHTYAENNYTTGAFIELVRKIRESQPYDNQTENPAKKKTEDTSLEPYDYSRLVGRLSQSLRNESLEDSILAITSKTPNIDVTMCRNDLLSNECREWLDHNKNKIKYDYKTGIYVKK